MNIGFNKPYLTGVEKVYIDDALSSLKLSGNGPFTKKCHDFFEDHYGIAKSLLTTSCTDALEMAAILCDIQPGDEVIMPSYTFVSTANAFVLRGAKIVFADSRPDHPGIDENQLEALITPRTKAIVPVHYAGVACDMDAIKSIADKHGLFVIEDAAQAIDSTYKGRPLGAIGDMGTFSFHETKNIIAGEGGLLAVNNSKFSNRAEIIWEKGTNRTAFWRGEVDKYGWVDLGSSFLASDITAAFLMAQLENIDAIQSKRKSIWNFYNDGLSSLEEADVQLPSIPDYASNNAHMYYLVLPNETTRDKLIQHLKSDGIHAVFHYQSLHKSPFYRDQHEGGKLVQSDRYSEGLLRLPLFYDLKVNQLDYIVSTLLAFFDKN